MSESTETAKHVEELRLQAEFLRRECHEDDADRVDLAADRLVEQANQLEEVREEREAPAIQLDNSAGGGWITEPPGPEINTSARMWVTYRNGRMDQNECWHVRSRWGLSVAYGVVAWQPVTPPDPYIPEETQ